MAEVRIKLTKEELTELRMILLDIELLDTKAQLMAAQVKDRMAILLAEKDAKVAALATQHAFEPSANCRLDLATSELVTEG